MTVSKTLIHLFNSSLERKTNLLFQNVIHTEAISCLQRNVVGVVVKAIFSSNATFNYLLEPNDLDDLATLNECLSDTKT